MEHGIAVRNLDEFAFRKHALERVDDERPLVVAPRVGSHQESAAQQIFTQVVCDVNSDMSDSWEWADKPRYPEKYSAQGIRIGVNYIVYAMTH